MSDNSADDAAAAVAAAVEDGGDKGAAVVERPENCPEKCWDSENRLSST